MKPGKWYERQQMTAVLGRDSEPHGLGRLRIQRNQRTAAAERQAKTVDFVLHIEPGRKIYVNEIHITGNNKTRDEVVRRELRQMESAPYDTSKLQRSKERVELLGYFDNVQFDAVPLV